MNMKEYETLAFIKEEMLKEKELSADFIWGCFNLALEDEPMHKLMVEYAYNLDNKKSQEEVLELMEQRIDMVYDGNKY